jgi:hypothetical protein
MIFSYREPSPTLLCRSWAARPNQRNPYGTDCAAVCALNGGGARKYLPWSSIGNGMESVWTISEMSPQ